MLIIPAIDLIHGRCVRLSRGNFETVQEYEKSPKEAASEYVSYGFSRVHVVDLDGARKGQIVQLKPISEILSVPGIQAQVGGGVRTEEHVEQLLGLGATQLVVGSVAMRTPETVSAWASKFGPEKFSVALDLEEGTLSASGWTQKERSTIDEIISKLEVSGITDYLCTDIFRDGMLEGPNFELYQVLVHAHPKVRWIASGGISSLEDLESLRRTGVYGAIVGKAIYEGRITLEELAEYAKSC
jgi:phosphoribosylformimino-5-aminoimidazole carboxamide ribotide isomerase